MVVGETKDVGFTIGVSRTLPYPVDVVWEFLLSPAGLSVWLGDGVELAPKQPYRTTGGTVGEVRSLHEHDRVRLTWRPKDWDHDTTVQVAMRGDGAKTMLRFHQEWLADADERSRQRDHWKAVMDKVIDALER
ncbi:SRPBCC family protein [Actinocrispum wychmicini]|uniref:Activator of Hsp90 ATPase-like protein n=1 Tax=Actinocrispum wychmicini TaxID=1213861 RepID=A0A4R2JEC4_9PSEU|nr:SRPBCC domain-containing protein [Actinocrispum wychmicini]TCO52605.1 activator of Hsp90 ATPase-like protein [Actinocrispum wychmicini]